MVFVFSLCFPAVSAYAREAKKISTPSTLRYARQVGITVTGRVLLSRYVPMHQARVEIGYERGAIRYYDVQSNIPDEAVAAYRYTLLAETFTDFDGYFRFNVNINPDILRSTHPNSGDWYNYSNIIVTHRPQMFGTYNNGRIVNYIDGVTNYNLGNFMPYIRTVPLLPVSGTISDSAGAAISGMDVKIEFEGARIGGTTSLNNGKYRKTAYLPRDVSWSEREARFCDISAEKVLYNRTVPIARFYGALNTPMINETAENGSVLEHIVNLICAKESLIPNINGLHYFSVSGHNYSAYGDASGRSSVEVDLAGNTYFNLNQNPASGQGYASVGFDLPYNSSIDIRNYNAIKVIFLLEANAQETNFWVNLRDPSWTDRYHVQAHTSTATIPAGNGNARMAIVDLNLNDLMDYYGGRPVIDLSRIDHVGIEFGEAAGNYNPSNIILYDIVFVNSL